MSECTIPTGKRRTAHLALLHVDLNDRINHLKQIWKQMEHKTTKSQPSPNRLTPMQHKAKEQIAQQQRNQPTKTPHKRTTQHNKIRKTTHQKFIERRAKKHPEIIPLHAPPMNFYQPNRPFESRQATYTEDRQRLEGCHQLLFQMENKQTKTLLLKHKNIVSN